MAGIPAFLETDGRDASIALGRRIGQALEAGDVVALTGELGSGKTTLVKGVAAGLGVTDENQVRSPSFVIMYRYRGRCPVYHLDLFRLEDRDQVLDIGWDDLINGDAVVLVEWAQKVPGYLPQEFLEIDLEIADEDRRRIRFVGHGARYEALARELLELTV